MGKNTGDTISIIPEKWKTPLLIFFIVDIVFGIWGVQIMPLILRTVLIIVGICAVLYLGIPWNRIIDWFIKDGIITKRIKIIPIVTVVVVGVLITSLGGQYILRALEGEPDIQNEYIKITTNPEYRIGEYPHALLVEFGVKQYGLEIDAVINTGSYYEFVEEWFGEPNKTDRSPKRVDRSGELILGSLIHDAPEKNPPIYKHHIYNFVEPDASYYFYFEGHESFRVKNIQINGRMFEQRGELWLPMD